LAAQQGANNGLSGHPAEIADGDVQLHVHLDQCLLHMLDAAPGVLDVLIPQPP